MGQLSEEGLIYDTLAYLKENETPAGAGSVQRYLETKGYMMAEATVGRLLRDLDCKGFTEKQSNQGRRLSENGEAYLNKLEERKWQGEWTEDFMGTVDNREKTHLLELLAARRPVEVETARLAAINATDADICALRLLVEKQEELARKGKPVSALDTEFHRKLAEAGKNPILKAIVELLRKKQEYAAEFEVIRRMAGHIYNNEHRKIFEAVEQKDPELAELTMKRHLDNLVKSVETTRR